MSEPDATTERSSPVDLSELRLMPDWVANFGKPQQALRHVEREDREGRGAGDRERRGRPPFKDRRNDRGGSRFEKGRPQDRRAQGDRRHDRPGGGDFKHRERAPLPTDIVVTLEPEEKTVAALAAHIRATGRAFSMFDASRVALESGDRFRLRIACAAERPAPLIQAPEDGSLFLTREEALLHILHSKVLEAYYKPEEIELEEPKGEFRSVAVCGMSGELLGPPNHHSYQTALLRLHRERFADVPLEVYKHRVRVEHDPDLVAKWKEQQKKGTRWTYLKGGPAADATPLVFTSRADMEGHFRRLHGADAISEVREALKPGDVPREHLSQILGAVVRRAVEHARNHPFEFSQRLGSALEREGLKLFKRRGGKLFVSRIRPRAVDPTVVFSERVAKLVDAIRQHPGIPIPKLLEAVAPSPQAEAVPPLDETRPAAAQPPGPADEQLAALKDLRWLADAGYVIEYSDGAVFLGVQGETAKKEAQPEATSADVSGSPPPAAAEPAPAVHAPSEAPCEPPGELHESRDDAAGAAVAPGDPGHQ